MYHRRSMIIMRPRLSIFKVVGLLAIGFWVGRSTRGNHQHYYDYSNNRPHPNWNNSNYNHPPQQYPNNA